LLFLYLAVFELVGELNKEQHLVYYVCHTLVGAELNYPRIEKFSYALVLESRKLHPYFEAHKVMVLTN